MSTRIWFDGIRTGHWEIACAELCGLGHYRMKGFVTVETPQEFEKWLAEQAAAGAPQAAPAGNAPAAAPPADPAAPAPTQPPAVSGQEGKQGS
jgi:cytochrome c oxidase subunit 2